MTLDWEVVGSADIEQNDETWAPRFHAFETGRCVILARLELSSDG